MAKKPPEASDASVAALAQSVLAYIEQHGSKTQGKDKDTEVVLARLRARKVLMATAIGPDALGDGAAFVLQARVETFKEDATTPSAVDAVGKRTAIPDIAGAVRYRLGIADLFVEKAQYYLEQRATAYHWLGVIMYGLAVALFLFGAGIAVYKMWTYVFPALPDGAADTDKWIDLLSRFVLAFTGYGFIVLTSVALARGARACLDQRERLLAKRHSLRQGRLYLHLAGGHVSIDEMERAFNWNHSQDNAFTHMPTDAKAPWGAVAEEIVKITPELVKTGVAAARGATEKAKAPESGEQRGT